LSYRDIEELLSKRGLRVNHATVNRWVIEYSLQLVAAFKTSKKPVKNSWCMQKRL
jgi:putative transposase